jgi:hypothetical protein
MKEPQTPAPDWTKECERIVMDRAAMDADMLVMDVLDTVAPQVRPAEPDCGRCVAGDPDALPCDGRPCSSDDPVTAMLDRGAFTAEPVSAPAPPNSPKEVEERCAHGEQWCHLCERWECGDNTNPGRFLFRPGFIGHEF